MNLLSLIKTAYLFDKISLSLDGTTINFKIDKEVVSQFDRRKEIQKLNFLLEEFNNFSIFNLIKEQPDYIWYLEGVYSQTVANTYYSIVNNENLIYSEIKTNSVNLNLNELDNQIKDSKQLLAEIKSTFDITGRKKLLDILELLSSIMYLKKYRSMTDKEKLKEFLSLQKPHLNKYTQVFNLGYDFVGGKLN
ncbi:MAG: hypothetical protein V1702_01905 [Candidatus Woesearchaeota archaeon]